MTVRRLLICDDQQLFFRCARSAMSLPLHQRLCLRDRGKVLSCCDGAILSQILRLERLGVRDCAHGPAFRIKYKMVQGPRREISLLSLGFLSHIRSHVPIQAVETPLVTASRLGPRVKRAASYC